MIDISLSKEQQRIFHWISNELELPVFADVFKGAVFSLSLRSSGYITFVAHAGRDIMNGLARESRGDKRVQINYQRYVGDVEEVWNDKWGGSAISFDDEEPPSYEIPNEVCKKVKALIDSHKTGRERSEFTDRLFFVEFLDYDDIKNIPKNYEMEWRRTRKWFLEHAHIRRNEYEPEVGEEIIEHFQTLETYLHTAASAAYSRFKQIQELDEILAQANR